MSTQPDASASTAERTREAVASPEYQAALAAQIDYDSTTKGQDELRLALENCQDDENRRGLRARLVGGRESRRFRQEQVVFMPPRLPGGHPARRAFAEIATGREELARLLGIAAAEADCWGAVTHHTAKELRNSQRRVSDLDYAYRPGRTADMVDPAWWRGAPAAEMAAGAPWRGSVASRPVSPGDVGVLILLGATDPLVLQDGSVVVAEDCAPARAWGYCLEATTGTDAFVVTTSPWISRWEPTGDGC